MLPKATPMRVEAGDIRSRGGGVPENAITKTKTLVAGDVAAAPPLPSIRTWGDAEGDVSRMLASPEVYSSRPTVLPGHALAWTFVRNSKPHRATNMDDSSIGDEVDEPSTFKAAVPQSRSVAAAMTAAPAADADEPTDEIPPSPHSAQLATTAAPVAPVRISPRLSRATPTHATAGRRVGISCSSVAQPRRPEESSLPAAADQEEGVVSPTIWRCEGRTPGPSEQQRRAAVDCVGGAAYQPQLLETSAPDPPRQVSSCSEEDLQMPQVLAATIACAAKTELVVLPQHPSMRLASQWDADKKSRVPWPMSILMPATPSDKNSPRQVAPSMGPSKEDSRQTARQTSRCSQQSLLQHLQKPQQVQQPQQPEAPAPMQQCWSDM